MANGRRIKDLCRHAEGSSQDRRPGFVLFRLSLTTIRALMVDLSIPAEVLLGEIAKA